MKSKSEFDKDVLFEDLAATYKASRCSLRKRISMSIRQIHDNDVYDYDAAIAHLNELIDELAAIEIKLHVLHDLDHDIDNEPTLLLD